jgi:hypothetical protein
VARWGAIEAQNRADDVACEGPSPEPRQSPCGCTLRPAPAHFQSPSDGDRGAAISQRRRRRSARSVSVSSQPRCTLGFTSRPTLRRPRGALGIDQSSETEPTTLHARAVMDRSRSAYLHDKGMGSHPRRYLCRTYDGTHAVPTTVPMPYPRRNSPRDSFAAVHFLATNRQLRGYGPGAERRAKLSLASIRARS